MQARCLGILISAVLVISTAVAQTAQPSTVEPEEITGAGTARFLARFSGPYRIVDSGVFEGSNGNIGIGTTTPNFKLAVFESRNKNPDGSQPYAVYGSASSTLNFAAGVRGDATSPNGLAVGVIGVAYGAGDGAIGFRTATGLGTGGSGVRGTTNTTSGFSFGARGTASGASGFSIGVFGEASSPDGLAARFVNYAGGNIVDATSASSGATIFRIDGSGTVYADGGFQPGGADFAESIAVTGDRSKYAAGDLLVIDPSGKRHLTLAQQPYSTLVAGIYSTKPGLLGSTRKVTDAIAKDEVPLAVVGIVPCKVTAENGPIQVGDLLVASSTPGHAMKGTDRSKLVGAVVGKALEPLPDGKGVIQVLVTLQ